MCIVLHPLKTNIALILAKVSSMEVIFGESIFPNIEFRIDKFVGKDNRSINYHVIFSDKLSTELIEKEFLEDVKFEIAGGEKRKLNRKNITEFGKKLKAKQGSAKGKDDWVVGCKNIVVSMDEIISALQKKCFEGKYILAVDEAGLSLIDWEGRDHTTRQNLLVKSHCIFSSNQNTRDWALGIKDIPREEFVGDFGSLKPCIHGSDCHCFEKLCLPDMNRFCWIKADASFEGLKQILYEPSDRIKIQAEDPQERKNIYSIGSVKLSQCQVNDELSIVGDEIGMNKNLVTIIGGKGSGKTAILDLIVNCFEERCNKGGTGAPIEKNSFVQRIESDNSDLEIGIDFIGPVEGFSKRFTEDKFFDLVKVTYLPQGQIEEYSSNRKKLNVKIQQVIFDNKQVAEGNFEEKFKKIKDEVEEIIRRVEETNGSIFSLEKETTIGIERRLAEELAKKDGELKNKNSDLEALKANVKAEAQGKAQDLRDNEKGLQEKKAKIESFLLECEALKQEFQYSKINLNGKIEKINNFLSEFNIENKVSDVDYSVQLVAIEKALVTTRGIETVALDDIKKVEKDLANLEGLEKAEAGVLKEISGIKLDITAVKSKISEVDGKKKKIDKLEKIRLDNFIELMCKFLEWRQFYKQVIEAFSKESSKILSGVKFESSVHFDSEEFINSGVEILNLVSVPEQEIKRFANILGETIKKESKKQIREDVNKFISEVMIHKNHLKIRKNSLDFYNWVFKNYYSLNTNVFFNDTNMDKLSIGQKGTVLLKIFLAEGDYPLIVDMPEENLDNKFIYDELKDAIRQAKKRRQIIIATNNANLVLNTDAEEVIVAEFKNNVIRYKVGSIEDTSIRDEMTHILEGGREALFKREQKYGFQQGQVQF